MKAKQLKKLLELIPDDAPILVSDDDHGYRKADADPTTALFDGYQYAEDHGEELTPEADYGKRIPVVVIR